MTQRLHWLEPEGHFTAANLRRPQSFSSLPDEGTLASTSVAAFRLSAMKSFRKLQTKSTLSREDKM
jgi:hypothetical protein